MRFGFGWKLCAIGVLLRWINPAAASAQAAQPEASPPQAQGLRVAVLRTTQGEAGSLADGVDGALLRDLASLAGIDNPTVSPIDYAEIQLTVGCSDEGRQCLSAIAQMVQVDAVVVRHLVVEPSRVTVTLTHFDATASDEPAHAEQVSEGPDANKAAVEAVPSLVRRLFGIPEPVAAASAASSAPTSGQGAGALGAAPAATNKGAEIGVLTWVTLAAGSGLLASGLVVGATAQSSFDAFKKTDVKNESDAMRANAKFDSVKSKALVANILIPSGAAVMALAAALFVFDLTRGEQRGERAKLGVQPLRGGAMLTLHAVAGGM